MGYLIVGIVCCYIGALAMALMAASSRADQCEECRWRKEAEKDE